jgi:hypothetical protein
MYGWPFFGAKFSTNFGVIFQSRENNQRTSQDSTQHPNANDQSGRAFVGQLERR